LTSTPTVTGARHRAARRPSTPLTSLVSGPGARRSLLTVASSGLALTMAATTAAAAPQSSTTQALPQVDVTSLTSKALTAMVTTPSVTVPADVSWSVEAVAAQATPAPEPEPEPAPAPAPVVERESATSRDTARAPLAEAAPVAAAAPAAQAAPAPAASASAVVDIARRYIGTPYVSGGATPAGFDCSGFTQYVFAQVGISLPRTSGEQRYAGTQVSAAEARPGDLVWGPGHVGIYTGNGQHIAARSPGTALYESPIYISNPIFIRVG
jgi:cell wall-associated NlpC family hydrolase